MSTDPSWADLAGPLPVHEDELLAAHQGAPPVAVQNATHGAPAAAVDNGMDAGAPL